MNIATYLTLMRLFISPIFLVIYLEHEMFDISLTALPYVLLFLLIISEVSDIFDGILARKYNQVTDLGKILDPMADSISHISIFLTFTLPPIQLPMLLILIFLYRDFLVSTIRTICALKGFALSARQSGKIKAITQGVAIFLILLLMIPYSLGILPLELFQQACFFIVSVSCFYTLYSGIDYVFANKQYISKLMQPQK